MASLRTVQALGVLTKIITLAFGVLQTAIVLRILSPAEFGIVGIVVSIGSLVGVSQHVGIVDATIREVAAARDAVRRAHVFWVSLWIRLLVTVPLSLLLALLATVIGTRLYPLPDVPHLVRLMSLVLVLQGVQGVVGGLYTGVRAFATLYAFQLVTAAVNIPLFAYLTFRRGVMGFFEAMAITTVIFLVLLAMRARRVNGGTLPHPPMDAFRVVVRDILHTSVWTYVARILSVAWQRVPLLLLGRFAPPDVVGLFNVALTFGSKLVILAQAIGEVNLAFLSRAFARSREAFRVLAARTLDEVGAVTLLGAGFLALFSRELLRLVAGEPYEAAATATAVVTWAYALYAFLDIGSNTLFVPARRAHHRAAVFATLFGVTVGAMAFLEASPLIVSAWGLLAGALASVAVGEVLARRLGGLSLVTNTLRVLLIPGVALMIASLSSVALLPRIVLAVGAGGAIVWVLLSILRAQKDHARAEVAHVS